MVVVMVVDVVLVMVVVVVVVRGGGRDRGGSGFDFPPGHPAYQDSLRGGRSLIRSQSSKHDGDPLNWSSSLIPSDVDGGACIVVTASRTR